MADTANGELAIAASEALPFEPLSWLPGGPLPPELLTGHESIDFEHRQLLACITAVRSVCQDFRQFKDCSNCLSSRQHLCESELVRLLGDLLAFILDHFKSEESIMRDSLLIMVDRDVCEAHMEDHAAISAKVQQIVGALDPANTVGLVRQLDTLLANWISNHIALHDVILARWVAQQESAFGQTA